MIALRVSTKDSHQLLAQLIVQKGPGLSVLFKFVVRFRTDPDIPGVEKLAISNCRLEAGCRPTFMIPASKVAPAYGKGLLGAQQAFMVKGWSRSLAACTILLAAYESEELYAVPCLSLIDHSTCEALPDTVRESLDSMQFRYASVGLFRSFRTIHGTVCVADQASLDQLIAQNRGGVFSYSHLNPKGYRWEARPCADGRTASILCTRCGFL